MLRLLLLAVIAAPLAADAPLRLQQKAGERCERRIAFTQTIALTRAGRTLETATTQTIAIHERVTAIEEGGTSAQVEQRIAWIRVEGRRGAARQFQLDTREDAPADADGTALHSELRALVEATREQPLRFRRSQRGEITQLVAPGGLPPALARARGLVFPSEAVAVGSRWQQRDALSTPAAELTVTSRYRYAADEQGLTRIALTQDLAVARATDPAVGVRLTGGAEAGRGELELDPLSGRLRRQQLRTRFTLELTAGGATTTQRIDQQLTITVEPLRD